MEDTRNVTDEFKGLEHEKIVEALDAHGSKLEIAIENTLRDYNMGTIVRTANAFGVRTVHVIGRKQWNKRGAMATDKYMHITYYATADEFLAQNSDKKIIAIDNVDGSQPLGSIIFPEESVLIFGQEGPGISEELLQQSDMIVEVEQYGSTRSINVGVAAGIVMYQYTHQHPPR